MADIKFTSEEINEFNHKISNVLDNSRCREVFYKYLCAQRHPVLIKTFKLWTEAHERKSYDEDTFCDLVEEVDDFNVNPLYSLSECEHKIAYIKQECCRILEKQRDQFILYLFERHKC